MPETKPQETRTYLYTISHDPTFLNEFFGVSLEVIEKISDSYYRVEEDPKGSIQELIELCREYPTLPQFKNLLGVAYHRSGDRKKAGEINNLIISEHPNYLFARINKAYEYLSLKQPEKVLELLGKWLQIKELYPERDTFHVGEVLAFYKLAFHYYKDMGKFEIAKSQFEAMETIDADHVETVSVRQEVLIEEYNRRNRKKYGSLKPVKGKR